jgi:nucleotide-binding universal stress UspA family protein
VNILIATDGSCEASAALRTAVRVLRPADRNLDVLCVAPPYPDRRRGGRQREDYERRILGEISQILADARSELEKAQTAASESAAAAGVVRFMPEIGSPSSVIVAKAGDYDLTVIGPKGQGAAPGEAGLGPVASRIVEYALAPVLIAREPRGEAGLRVLVAADGSRASLHAIVTLRSLFDLSGADICLMHVRETPWVHLGLNEDWETYDDDEKERSVAGAFEKEMIREGDTIVEQARELLHAYRPVVSTRIDEGNPSDEILSEAERGQYDLVVLGATGTRDLKHSMLGSVSAKVAWNAPCSVLIVREPE